jgi:DNA polymerase (family 10)
MLSSTLIIDTLNHIAVCLELKGENPFKARAYQQAAHALSGLSEDLATHIKNGQLDTIAGIGPKIGERIVELYETGRCAYYDELKSTLPSGLFQCLDVPGLGPKKLRVLFDTLQVSSLEDLKKVCLLGQVQRIRGFGEKTVDGILKGIENLEKYRSRHLRAQVVPIVEAFVARLKDLPQVQKVEPAGSYRRGLETVGDLDFLVASDQPQPVMAAFTHFPEVAEVTSSGLTKSSIRLESGLQADLRVVSLEQFPFALHHFTGSKDHNIAMRSRALHMGYSLSEWGFKATEEGKAIPDVKNEEGIFKALGLNFIPPVLREGMGEIEYAQNRPIPQLVELKDIRGAFHNHTIASDGEDTLEAMVQAAENLGWEYLGIADHSKSSYQARGLSEEQLLAQIEAIRQFNRSRVSPVYVFSGTECDILPDGTLDYPDSILSKLDYVVASVHSSFTQDEETMTARIIKALENPYVRMLGHISGRLLLKREPYAVNIPKIIDAAIANRKIIELNANPKRLDMDWRFWHKASQKGLICSINPDAHRAEHLKFVEQAIPMAQKGWLQAKSVFNTWSFAEVRSFFVQKILPKVTVV